MKTSPKKRLLGGIKKKKICGKDCPRPSRRRRDSRATRSSQSSVSITKVHAVLQRVPSVLRGGTCRQHPRVLVETLCFSRRPTQKLTNPPCCHVLGLSRCIHTTTRSVVDNRVFVLNAPAVAITNSGTASEFLADGWSTESVSRVVRTARTRQENNERKRAEHASR